MKDKLKQLKNSKLFNILIGCLCITILIGVFVWLNLKNQNVFPNDIQTINIFETNLPDIDKEPGSNLFITADKSETKYKNINVFIVKNGVKNEIESTYLKDALATTNEYETKYAGKSEYFIIRALVLKNDPDIGIIHEHLDIESYKNSSGYILDEKIVSERKNLCVSTSSVYNNWICFVFDKEKNNFVLSYAQNFAD